MTQTEEILTDLRRGRLLTPLIFQRDGNWWDFYIGRLHISKGPFRWIEKKRSQISEAPGFWYFRFYRYQIAWRRRWTVWKDHPFRSQNIRLYDQFGTFARRRRHGNPT